MAWIESHQELGAHPKTRKLARVLGISRPAVVGHLQFLWWWAMDYAQDGSLSRFDALDIALGAEWDEDAETFVQALTSCGFLSEKDDHLVIHDWHDYAGKLIERREKDAARKRGDRRPPDNTPQESAKTEPSNGTPTDVHRTAHVTVPNRTQPNPTEPPTGVTTAPSAQTPPRPVKQASGKKPVTVLANAERPPVSENPPAGPPPLLVDAPPAQPFDLLEALCDEVGADLSVLAKPQKDKQLSVAKRLVESGMTARDVRAMTRWLLGQDWVTSGVDLFLLEKQLGKWQMQGKPATTTAKPRGRAAATEQVFDDALSRTRGHPPPKPARYDNVFDVT